MAKPLIFTLDGAAYEAAPSKLERKKIYGFTEMKATTPEGEACRQVSLDGNGMTVIPKGAVKMAMTDAQGLWVEKADLTPRHADGREVEPVPSSFDAPIALDTTATEEDLLDLVISSVYQLDGSASDGGDASDGSAGAGSSDGDGTDGSAGAGSLAKAIGDRIFTFPFSYRGGNKADTAFLLAAGDNVFVLVGDKADFEMLSLAEQAVLDEPEEESEEETDDLDFSMF